MVNLNRSRGATPDGNAPGAGHAGKGPWGRWRNRLLLTVGAVGVVGALVTATSFALFTSQSSAQTDAFAAGTVIVTSGSPSCTFSNMEAGDSESCQYKVSYTGSLNAWISLEMSATSTAEAAYYPVAGTATLEGGQALLNNVGTNGLHLSITGVQRGTSTSTSYPLGTLTCNNVGTAGTSLGQPGYQDKCTAPTQYPTITGQGPYATLHCATTNSCTTVGGNGSVKQGWTDTFTITGTLPLSAGNKYQGSMAKVTLVANAVQASNYGGPQSLVIASNNTWLAVPHTGITTTYTSAQPAQEVCLSSTVPYNCPTGALDYNMPGANPSYWSAPLGQIPTARWIWSPLPNGASTPVTTNSSVYLQDTFTVGAPVLSGSVTLYTAADNYASVYVNGQHVGTVGSTVGAGTETSFDTLTPITIPASDFHQGTNTIIVHAVNDPNGHSTYQGDPAGIVLGGTLHLA